MILAGSFWMLRRIERTSVTSSARSVMTLSDSWRFKLSLMEATVYAHRRASFTNANDGPISPFTRKPITSFLSD